MATRLSRGRLRAGYLAVLLGLPLAFGLGTFVLVRADPPGSAPSTGQPRPAPPLRTADPAPAAPPQQQPAPAPQPALELNELRRLARGHSPDGLLRALGQLDADPRPEAAQLRATALTALRSFPHDPRVASVLTARAQNTAAPRIERVLALDGLREQHVAPSLRTLLKDDDALIRARVEALLAL